MLTYSFQFSRFNNLAIFPEKPKLVQFIPGIYNKNYYKISRVFLGRYRESSRNRKIVGERKNFKINWKINNCRERKRETIVERKQMKSEDRHRETISREIRRETIVERESS